MRIGILGPGRVGRSLAVLWERAGHQVELRGRGEGWPTGDVRVLAVPDGAIAEVAAALPPGAPVLHLSGALNVAPLRPHAPAGVLHPLMTFPGPEIALPNLEGVPARVEGDDEAMGLARQLAHDLGMAPIQISGDLRLYHAAAVMAGNFATVLLAEAAEVLALAGVEEGKAAGHLAPLALASLTYAADDPGSALTGPAARGDTAVVQAHRDALRAAGRPELLTLYDTLAQRAQYLAKEARSRRNG